MAKDTRPYFILTNEYPRHRKIRGLSDKAFRLHITLLGLCNEDRNEDRNDGIIGAHDLEMMGVRPGQELISNGLVTPLDDGISFKMHDYLKHQNSADEIQKRMKERAESGRRGGILSAHKRHHLNKCLIDQNCLHCPSPETAPTH